LEAVGNLIAVTRCRGLLGSLFINGSKSTITLNAKVVFENGSGTFTIAGHDSHNRLDADQNTCACELANGDLSLQKCSFPLDKEFNSYVSDQMLVITGLHRATGSGGFLRGNGQVLSKSGNWGTDASSFELSICHEAGDLKSRAFQFGESAHGVGSGDPVLPNSMDQTCPQTPKTQRNHLLLSGRFNAPEKLAYISKLKELLDVLEVPTFMVGEGPGGNYGRATKYGLYHMKAMCAVCHEDYGEKTGAQYETFIELEYAWEERLPIFPVRLCDDWPPVPRDDDGKAQNSLVFKRSLVTEDGRKKNPEEIAQAIAMAWFKLP